MPIMRFLAAILVLAFGFACTSTAATPAPTSQATTRRPAALAIGISSDEGTLTPYTFRFGYPGYVILTLVYDTLLLLDADNVPRPLLAKDFKASADGSSYDITLRQGVRWHDGQALTVDDVKFTYEYFLKNTQSRFTTALRPVASVTISGSDSISIKLSAPNPSFPIRALADVPILPRHFWETVAADKTKDTLATIGSGPYKLIEANVDSGYTLRANDDYFLGPPPVQDVTFPIIKDVNTALQALRAGQVQGITRGLTPEQIPQFNTAPFKVARGPGFASTLIQMNNERPGLDRVEVRQAIDLAIDKKKLVDTVLTGAAAVGAPGFIHPDSPFHDASVQPRFDPASARQLLDRVGAAAGADGVRKLDGKPLSFTLLVYSTEPVRVRTAELISAMLKDIGIEASVKALDTNAVDALVWPEFNAEKGRDFDLAMWGWSAPLQVDPGRLVDLVHSDFSIGRNNIGAYRSADATRIADDLRTTSDDQRRKELVQSLERTLANDVPFVTLFFQDGDFAYRADAFDGWVYQKGQGIYNKLSFLPGFSH